MKDEYISKQQALDELFCESCTYAATRVIENIPPADVAPVVHGKDLAQPSLFKCSVCGCEDDDTYTCDVREYHYCPNCGAKMDEKAKPDPSVVTIYKCSNCGMKSPNGDFCDFCGSSRYKEDACEADTKKTT